MASELQDSSLVVLDEETPKASPWDSSLLPCWEVDVSELEHIILKDKMLHYYLFFVFIFTIIKKKVGYQILGHISHRGPQKIVKSPKQENS